MSGVWGVFLFVLMSIANLCSAECPASPSQDDVNIGDFPFQSEPGEGASVIFEYDTSAMSELHGEFYASGRVATNRMYNESGEWKLSFRNDLVSVPSEFVNHLQIGIDELLKKDAFDYLFFPDAGHAHIMLRAGKEFSGKSLLSESELEKLLADGDLALLFHSGEQLDYGHQDTSRSVFERNSVVEFSSRYESGPESYLLPITERQEIVQRVLDGYDYTSMTIYFHASQSGCLRAESADDYFYDISMKFY